MCNTIGCLEIFFIYSTSSNLCPTHKVGLGFVNGLIVNFGSYKTLVHINGTYAPSNTFKISLSLKLY